MSNANTTFPPPHNALAQWSDAQLADTIRYVESLERATFAPCPVPGCSGWSTKRLPCCGCLRAELVRRRGAEGLEGLGVV